jgi:Protein of unknown function (DUF3667)
MTKHFATNSDETVTCLNCGHAFSGAYCPACGQKHGAPMPTTKEIVGDLMRSALSPGGKLFESLRVLMLKPGELTRAYLAGQRLRYVHPVRLYLLGVFLFVAAVNINTKWREWHQQPPFEIAAAHAIRPPEESAEKRKEQSRLKGEEFAKSIKETLPAWMIEWIKQHSERVGEESPEKMQARALKAMTGNYSLLFAVMIPFTALVNWLLYLRRGYSYAAHFVFMLHGTAASSLIFLVSYATNLPIIYYPLLLVTLLWFVAAGRRAFGVSWWGSLWRYGVLFVPTGLVSGALGIALAVVTILFA